MATRYINVSVGPKLKNGDYVAVHQSHAAVPLNQVSIVFDDTVVTNINQLKAAVMVALQAAAGLGSLTAG
jgi:hypothetical protein